VGALIWDKASRRFYFQSEKTGTKQFVEDEGEMPTESVLKQDNTAKLDVHLPDPLQKREALKTAMPSGYERAVVQALERFGIDIRDVKFTTPTNLSTAPL
jgi:hypothetical protein